MSQNVGPCKLSRTPDGLVYTGDTLTYRITGLTAHNLDRLRVTLRANPPDAVGTFHVDTIDLYFSRAREGFAEACAKYLKAQQGLVMAELSLMIGALEAERIVMREKGEKAAAIPEMTEEEKKEALDMLKSKGLLDRIVIDFDGLGYIGEPHNKLLCYIATISRLMPDPLAVLILSRPGAGKTHLQETACKLVPPESAIQYTRLTGQALFYGDPNALRNKVMAIEEDEGMQAAMYSVKTLISSQKLSVAATRTDPKTGKMSVDEYTVYGPVVVFVSTTRPNGLDDETKRRFLVLTIDETDEQTKQILIAQRTRNSPRWYQTTADESIVTKLHHNMQRLLKPITVMVPDELKIEFPGGRLQMRHEQKKFYSLVKAITLLHQYQRKRGTTKRIDGSDTPCIFATQQDVNLAFEIGRAVFIRNIDDVSPTGRSLLTEIDKLVTEKYAEIKRVDPKRELLLSEIPFTRKELREETTWSETQIRVNIEPLVELGYLGKLAGRQGSACRYLMLDNGKDDPQLKL